jgi:hypothetical protein
MSLEILADHFLVCSLVSVRLLTRYQVACHLGVFQFLNPGFPVHLKICRLYTMQRCTLQSIAPNCKILGGNKMNEEKIAGIMRDLIKSLEAADKLGSVNARYDG